MVTQQTTPQDHLSVTFAALADPTRRSMLVQLRNGEATVAELAAPHSISRPAISRHLRVLERAGLIARTKDRQWRRIAIEGAPLKCANDWINTYRQIWEQRFDALARHLEAMEDDSKTDTQTKDSSHDDQ